MEKNDREKGEILNKCGNLEIGIAENNNCRSHRVISGYRPITGNDKGVTCEKDAIYRTRTFPWFCSLPMAAQAAEITLVPSVKLQIGDRDNRGYYWGWRSLARPRLVETTL